MKFRISAQLDSMLGANIVTTETDAPGLEDAIYAVRTHGLFLPHTGGTTTWIPPHRIFQVEIAEAK